MILSNRSAPRSISLRSAPNKSRNPVELPSVVNNSIRSSALPDPASKGKTTQNGLALNNYMGHMRVSSEVISALPNLQIDALNELCNQLIKDQEDLRKRLEIQELMIESLRKEGRGARPRLLSQEPVGVKRNDSNPRKLPGFTTRGSEESGFFTFRPSDSNPKTKFPREIFSRKSRTKPQ